MQRIANNPPANIHIVSKISTISLHFLPVSFGTDLKTDDRIDGNSLKFKYLADW
jgi:hypothetical protein